MINIAERPAEVEAELIIDRWRWCPAAGRPMYAVERCSVLLIPRSPV